MKTVDLVGKYFPFVVSKLNECDCHRFRKLQKGKSSVNSNLYITRILPIDMICVYKCRGFQLENYQIIFSIDSKGEDNFFLVFRAEPLGNQYKSSLYANYCLELKMINANKGMRPYVFFRRVQSYDESYIKRELCLPK